MRSLAGMPTASVTGRVASHSRGSKASTRTHTSLRPIWVMVARHCPPSPLNRVMVCPGWWRSTCTWRAVPGGSASSAPLSSGRGQW